MLGKLFKYEFRATGRIFLPSYAVLLVMSFVARLFYSANLAREFTTEGRTTLIVTMVMVMLFTAVWVVTLVVVIRRFWTNLLGREGYLMNVLPVSPWEHVCSKAVTSLVWVLLSGLVSFAALIVMLMGTTDLVDWRDLFSFGSRIWSEGWDYLRAEGADTQAALLIVQSVIDGLVSVISLILTAYAAMSIGQLANRHRVWASIGAYFGITIVRSIVGSMLFVSSLLGSFAPMIFGGVGVLRISGVDGPTTYFYGGAEHTLRDFLAAYNSHVLLQLIFELAVCVLLFWLSQRLLKKRLNLQ